MSVRFVLGRSGTGKTRHCLERIVTELVHQGEQGPPLVWLVPEQATYQVERAILSDPRVTGFSRLRVLSFNRLSFHLLGRAAGQRELTRVGRKLLLGRLLEQTRDNLEILGGSADQPGLAALLEKLVTECQHQNCRAHDLARAADQLEANDSTALKLRDLSRVLEAYETYLCEARAQLVDPGLELTHVRASLSQASWLVGAQLWIDGFAGFTGQEWGVLTELLRCVTQTEVALCVDPRTLDLSCRNPEELNPESLFSVTERLYVDMAGVCDRLDLPIATPIQLSDLRRFQTTGLQFIESELYTSTVQTAADATGIELVAAPHTRAEIEQVTRRLTQLVREAGYRYRDIAVVVPDLNAYQGTIEAAFADAKIPYFLDRPRSLAHHPLIELLQAALRVVLDGFHSADVLALLKTDLGPLMREETFALENYVLTLGIEGQDWTTAEPWTQGGAIDARLDDVMMEALRQRVRDPLVELARDWAVATMLPERWVCSLWTLLTRLKVPETLAQWAQDDPLERHGQVLDKVVDLLDQLTLVLGSSPMSPVALGRALVQGLGDLSITLIPPTLDQVLVGAIERSRHPEIRAAFLVGVTQAQFPVPLHFDSLLTDHDRAVTQTLGLDLNPPVLEDLIQRQYLAYIALTRASNFLSVSYPVTDTRGSAQEPALVVEELQTLFPTLTLTQAAEVEVDLQQVTGMATLADVLCLGLAQENSVTATAQLVAALAQQEASPYQAVGQCLRSALAYTNTAQINADLMERFSGTQLTCSATALETYAACPYRYFAGKILRLKPRRPLGFDALDSGDLYHRILDHLFRSLREQGHSWGDMDEGALSLATDAAFSAVLQGDSRLQRFMAGDGHRQYTVERLGRILRDCVRDLAAMIRGGQFTPVATELSFGDEGDLEALTWELVNERRLCLVGRIDRVDCHGETAIVFDYKKGAASAKFDLGRWYHGLSLQTALYTLVLNDVVIAGQHVTDCAGAFLVPVEAFAESRRYGEAEREGFARKAKGLFDGRYALDLDREPGRYGSRFYSFSMKGDEPYGREDTSSAYPPQAYQQILRHTRSLIEDLGRRLFNGHIGIEPYSLSGKTPCDFCDFAALCKFDWQITVPRLLPKLGRAHVLKALEETYA